MSTPFPGMNPYLEAPDIWRDFYYALPVYIREQLTPQLPRYIAARLDVRYWYGTAEREKLITMLRTLRNRAAINSGPVSRTV